MQRPPNLAIGSFTVGLISLFPGKRGSKLVAGCSKPSQVDFLISILHFWHWRNLE
jgi:hypothetical protein